MKVTFNGWGRALTTHVHPGIPVSPTRNNKFTSGKSGSAVEWHSSNRVYAKLERLQLSGSFLMQIDFENKELRSWLRKYIAEKPEAALRLLSEMHAQAVLELTKPKQ